jgi:hypothetical protein
MANVLEEQDVSEFIPENGGSRSMFLRNINIYPQVHMALQRVVRVED